MAMYIVNDVEHLSKSIVEDKYRVTLRRIHPPSYIEHDSPEEIELMILDKPSADILNERRPAIEIK